MLKSTSTVRSTPLRALSVAALLLAATAPAALAQSGSAGAGQPPTSGSDRLFLNFIQEATVVDGQWWEARVEFADYDYDLDTTIVRAVAAFAVSPDLEMGGTVGFGSSSSDVVDINGDELDGTGATDLDAYAKYYFGSRDGKSEFAVGGILTVPTGDDRAGLGMDAFGLGGFASMRYRLPSVILGGNVGFRLNGDARVFGSPNEIDGKFSASVGFGAIIPLADRFAVVGETYFETKKFDGGEAYWSVLGGINWRVSNRGQIRVGLEGGLDDAAPDWRFVAGYAHSF